MTRTAESIQLTLSEPVRAYLDAQIAAGLTASANEYILRLIEEDRQLGEEEGRLRSEVEEGLADVERGEYTDYESPEAVAAAVKTRGRAWLGPSNAERQP